ncbi:hypothetical protein, partial [Leifsonia sp. TF02-11]|uniref:hypothetical protein n=1 Tax=Leifsonia sp. TF02-11 TaxID=2815212 RepID=UPI001AA0B97C
MKATNGTHAVSAVSAARRPIGVRGSAAIAHPSTAYRLTVSTHSRFSSAEGLVEPTTPTRPPRSSGPMFLVSMANTRILITPLVDRFVCLSGGEISGEWEVRSAGTVEYRTGA